MSAGHQNREHEVDRWLDNELAKYAKVEPRPGLEGRVLARLAEQKQARRNIGLLPALAFATTVLLALLFVWHEQTRPVVHLENSVAKSAGPVQPLQAPTSSQPSSAPTPGARALVIGHTALNRRSLPGVHRSGLPVLEQFPAPTPLTDQEKLLVRYVREFPERAVLVARAQTELKKRDKIEMATPWPNTAVSDADSGDSKEQ